MRRVPCHWLCCVPVSASGVSLPGGRVASHSSPSPLGSIPIASGTFQPRTFASTLSEGRMRPSFLSSSAIARAVGTPGRSWDRDAGSRESPVPAPEAPAASPVPPARPSNAAGLRPPSRSSLEEAILALSARSPLTPASSDACISLRRAISRLCASSIRVRSAASFRSLSVASSAMRACLSNSAWNLAACDWSSNCSTPAVSSAATASSPLPPTCVPCDLCPILLASLASSSSRSARPAAALTASRSFRADSRSRCSR